MHGTFISMKYCTSNENSQNWARDFVVFVAYQVHMVTKIDRFQPEAQNVYSPYKFTYIPFNV